MASAMNWILSFWIQDNFQIECVTCAIYKSQADGGRLCASLIYVYIYVYFAYALFGLPWNVKYTSRCKPPPPTTNSPSFSENIDYRLSVLLFLIHTWWAHIQGYFSCLDKGRMCLKMIGLCLMVRFNHRFFRFILFTPKGITGR